MLRGLKLLGNARALRSICIFLVVTGTAAGWAGYVSMSRIDKAVGILLVLAVVHTAAQARYAATAGRLAVATMVLAVWQIADPNSIGADTIQALTDSDFLDAIDFFLTQAHGRLVGDPKLERVALRYGVLLCMLLTAAILAHRWHGVHAGSAVAAALVPGALFAAIVLPPALADHNRRISVAVQSYRDAVAHFDSLAPLQIPAVADARARDLDIVFYIGESTTRWHWSLYGYPRLTDLPMLKFAGREGFVKLSDAISPHSHTTPSLLEMLSEADYPERPIEAASISVVALAKALGFRTAWYSNQNRLGIWDSLVSRHAALTDSRFYASGTLGENFRFRATDDRMIDRFIHDRRLQAAGPQFSVLHGYAGHWDYCGNIGTPVLFDDFVGRQSTAALLGDRGGDRRAIDCYDAAMRAVATHVGRVFEMASEAIRPTIVVYAPDHGEDPWAGTGHDSSRHSSRHVEVPVFFYWNTAALAAEPAMFAELQANADRPFKTSWLYDTLAGLLGAPPTLFDIRRSIVAPGFSPPPRYSVPRASSHVVYDAHAPQVVGMADAADQLLRARRMLSGLPNATREKVCAHRANSIAKYVEALRLFSCVELDIVLSDDGEQAWIHHPPKPNVGLEALELLRIAGLPERGLWFDVKNLTARNARAFAASVSGLVPAGRRRDFVIETDNVDSSAVRAFLDFGFSVSYYLPTAEAVSCTHRQCQAFSDATLNSLASGGFTHLSFDAAALSYVETIIDRLPPEVGLLAWSDQVGMDAALTGSALAKVEKLIVPFDSPFGR